MDATLRLFVPDIELEEIRPKPFLPRHAAFRGEVSRIIFETFRHSNGPMTAQQIAQRVMVQRGLNTADKRLVRFVMRLSYVLQMRRCFRSSLSTVAFRSFLLATDKSNTLRRR